VFRLEVNEKARFYPGPQPQQHADKWPSRWLDAVHITSQPEHQSARLFFSPRWKMFKKPTPRRDMARLMPIGIVFFKHVVVSQRQKVLIINAAKKYIFVNIPIFMEHLVVSNAPYIRQLISKIL
jgi:hypothetical protein